jgi:GNAT superfamily N-acetyltransferase
MIEYSNNHVQEAADVAEVFRASGMKRPYDDLDRIQRMIDQADVLITAWEDGRMVGVARGITDFSYCCYLSDLAVIASHQRLGIGKELMDRVRQAIGEECSLVLLAAPDAVSYYPQLGFERSERAFVLARGR